MMKALLPLLLCTVHGLAQTVPDTVIHKKLDEIVVSANKIPELRSKLAQQVSLLSSDQIQMINAGSTSDVLRQWGSVFVQKSQQGGGSPVIRGFEANRIVLVVDGVRMNNLIYRGGHLQSLITVDNNSLDRMEVLYGPSSTVYGSDALGGVIHLQTKTPVLSDSAHSSLIHTHVQYRFNSNKGNAFHVDINMGGKRLGFLTSVTQNDFGDLRMGRKTNQAYGAPFGLRPFYVGRASDNLRDSIYTNQDPYVQKHSGYRQYDVMQKVMFRQGYNVAHTLNFQYSTSTDIPRYDRLTDMSGAQPRFAEWYYGPQKRMMVAYNLHAEDLGPWADALILTASYQGIEEERKTRRFNSSLRRVQSESVRVGGLTLDFQKSQKEHHIRYGLDMQWNALHSTAYGEDLFTGTRLPGPTRYPDGKNRLQHYALYVAHSRDFKKTKVSSGIRSGYSVLYSRFNDKTFFPFPYDQVDQKNKYASASLGLVYRPRATWKISVLGSTGYRVPNVDDVGKVFDTQAGTALIVPNPLIKPEKTMNMDVGFARNSHGYSWENTFFYTVFYDAIVLDGFLFNGQPMIDYEGVPTRVLANQNKRKAFITGFSSRLVATLTKGITAEGSFHYTYGRIRTDSTLYPLDHISPAMANTAISYKNKKWNAKIIYAWNGWKGLRDYFMGGEDNEGYATPRGTPSWFTVDLRIEYFLTGQVSIQGGVDNIFDLQYRPFASGINAPGRSFMLTLRSSF